VLGVVDRGVDRDADDDGLDDDRATIQIETAFFASAGDLAA